MEDEEFTVSPLLRYAMRGSLVEGIGFWGEGLK